MCVELVAVVRLGSVRAIRVFLEGCFFRRLVKPDVSCLVRLAFDVSRLPPQTQSAGDAQKPTPENARNRRKNAQKLRAGKSLKKPEKAGKRRKNPEKAGKSRKKPEAAQKLRAGKSRKKPEIAGHRSLTGDVRQGFARCAEQQPIASELAAVRCSEQT